MKISRRLALPILFAALTACSSLSPGHNAIDSKLAAFIPPDATMLAGIRMDALRVTPLFQKLAAGRSIPQLDAFIQETGFDPRRDVHELLLASNGKDLVLAARGNFSAQAFAPLTKQSYQGYVLYSRGPRAVALIDNSTAVAGTLAAVQAALDRYRSGERSGPPDLLSRARRIPTDSQIWSVSSGFESLLTVGLPENGNAANLVGILEPLENATFAADVRTGINASLTGTCRTEQEAKNVGDTARGVIGLARLSGGTKHPELLRLWDGIQVDQQQRTIHITFVIPPDLLEKVMELLGVTAPESPPPVPSSGQESRRPE